METRGEKSQERKLAAVITLPPPECRPPEGMTAEQGRIWTEIVASKPPGWFGKDSAALLESYCIAITRRRMITAKIEVQSALKRPNIDKLAQLLELERRQTATISSLSTKMRLSQQSRYTPQRAATEAKQQPSGVKEPWAKS